jgi:hypothetical protein
MPEEKKIIAVDFDGTIVEHKFPHIGQLQPGAKRVLNKWHDEGIQVIIWTCRNQVAPEWGPNADLSAVRKFLENNDIKFATINEQAPGIGFRMHSPKVYADMYIDDRNLGGFPGWTFVEKAVESFYANDKSWREVFLTYEPATLFPK